MQRQRALAWLGAAGLGTLATVLLLTGDDIPLASVSLDGALPSEWDTSPPEPLAARAPTLEPGTTAEQAVRRLARRLRRQPGRPPSTLAQLVRAPGWIRFLRIWLHLPEPKDDEERLARIQEAFAAAEQPVVRQNLIFLAELVLPPQIGAPWLETVRADGDDADAEDALCALAFGGDPRARAAFLRLATSPSPATVRRIVDWYEDHEAIGRRGGAQAREILRSYRAVEAWSRRPYFKMTWFLATRNWDYDEVGRRLGWTPRAAWPGGAGVDRETIDLLEAWIQRYPGHPGSDDLALIIAQTYREADDLVAATRWYSRAAVLPDQDVAFSAATGLVSMCEVHLRPEDLLYLSEDEGLSTPNRRYYQYAYVRRLAAGRGLAQALGALQDLAAREPDSELGVAWARRFSVPPTKGIDSGLASLPQDDPLRRVEPARTAWAKSDRSGEPFYWWGFGIHTSRWDEARRLRPWPEVVVIHRGRLMRQIRAWVTLDELERRTAKARGRARADLLYKQAAVYHHDRDVLFPAYGSHTGNFRGYLGGDERFEEESFAWIRALKLFHRLEREHPDYPALDKVLFSQGILWKRLVDYRPHWYWSAGQSWEDWRGRREGSVRRVALTFERLAHTIPDSPLAGDARAAAAYWRRTWPGAFRHR